MLRAEGAPQAGTLSLPGSGHAVVHEWLGYRVEWGRRQVPLHGGRMGDSPTVPSACMAAGASACCVSLSECVF